MQSSTNPATTKISLTVIPAELNLDIVIAILISMSL